MGVGEGERDWLTLLCAGLERLHVRVLACRSTAGELLLHLSDSEDHRLIVTANRDSKPPFYSEADGLYLRYQGSAALREPESRALSVLLRLLGGMGSRIPADLESSTARAPAGAEPQAQLAFAFPFCSVEREQAGPEEAPRISEVLVRVTGRCNQACPFCSAPVARPDPSPEALERLFSMVERISPTATITLTGGEPTLRRDLPHLAARALASVPRGSVEIQTNAVRLAEGSRAEALPASTRLRFFVSLHGVDEHVYDAATGTQGMLGRASSGITNLLGLGHEVVLSCVVSSLNAASLEDWVDGVARRFPGPERPRVHFSITLCPEHRPEAQDYLLRYRELGRLLAAAEGRAHERGLGVEPLLSSTHAAIPACMVEGSLQRRQGAPLLIESHESGYEGDGKSWIKAERCRACTASGSCLGVPAAYAERFGLDELDPEEVVS